MRKNMGSLDQIIRLVVAITVGLLIITNVITGLLAIILGILAAVFLLTSLVSFCPLYTLLGINTTKL